MKGINYIQSLDKVFESRRGQNLKYSKRAFARDLGIDPGDLTKVIKGQKSVSPRVAYRIGILLGLSGESMVDFLHPTLQ